MNKQELINRLKEILITPSEIEGSDYDYGHNYGIERAISLAEDLDEQQAPINEPEKPKVPQVAVEFYERYKDDNLALGEWFDDFYSPEAIEEFPRMDELTEWLYDNNDETNRQREFALATLVTLGIDAVEVEKEKLYRAKNRHTGEYLCYCFEFYHDKNSSSENQRFTAEEKCWEELGYWDNDLYVFEEAKGEDE